MGARLYKPLHCPPAWSAEVVQFLKTSKHLPKEGVSWESKSDALELTLGARVVRITKKTDDCDAFRLHAYLDHQSNQIITHRKPTAAWMGRWWSIPAVTAYWDTLEKMVSRGLGIKMPYEAFFPAPTPPTFPVC